MRVGIGTNILVWALAMAFVVGLAVSSCGSDDESPEVDGATDSSTMTDSATDGATDSATDSATDGGTDGTSGGSTTEGTTDECDPCDLLGTPPDCDGDTARSYRSVQDPDTCDCSTATDEVDCSETDMVCEGGACVTASSGVECTEDEDCTREPVSYCDAIEVITDFEICDTDAGRCISVEEQTLCPNGCLTEEGGGGRCIDEIACPDDECSDDDLPAPFCDEDSWVTSLRIPDPAACDECLLVEQRFRCGEEERCDDDEGCVSSACAVPCPVFDPPAPTCDGDELVEVIGLHQDTETCECQEVSTRVDCTITDEICLEGACVAPE